MPFYEYQCSHCHHDVEVLQKITEPPLKKCPSCGRNTLTKLISAPVFRLKGSGWYETDFKSDQERKRNLAGADKPDTDAKSDAKSEPKSEAKSEGTSDAKPTTEAKAAKGESAPKSEAKSEPKPAAKPVASRSAAKAAPRKNLKKTASKTRRRGGR